MKKSVGFGVNTSQNILSHSQSFVGVGQDQGLGAQRFSVKLRNSVFFQKLQGERCEAGEREITWYLERPIHQSGVGGVEQCD